jgi:outer membrane protein OmpA-like peptidoglycan-associated protein
VPAEFENGSEAVARAILARIDAMEIEKNRTTGDLMDARETIEALRNQVADLDRELGGVSREAKAMRRQMEADAAVREKFQRVGTMFAAGEARVLREGDELILRLVGLSFESGKADILPHHFDLMAKVQEAILLFPDAHIRVEGHTDSHGTDEANLELSQRRAQAVRQHLVMRLGLRPDRTEATGFGEEHPIASNETEDGRSRNRRIDVVIRPDGGAAR